MSCSPEGSGNDSLADGVDSDGHCADVVSDVWRFLDDELDPERRAIVQRHLDECSPCLEEAGIDTKLKALLARKCGGDHAPEQLRQRIVTQLVAWHGDGTEGVFVATTSVTTVSPGEPRV
ncbi:MAG: mycothiol system anti-sigma-R factor [Nakamurella sp.]